MNEFSLINQLVKSIPIKRADVLLGIGDDAACLHIPEGMNLLVSTDTLVAGVHFLPEWDAYDIACRAVMVNVSDLAAMAAQPCWITLALTLPEPDPQWLNAFARGLKDSLTPFNMDLVGGDTTRGPLSITLTVMGFAPPGQSTKRSGAKPGDVILVSGPLGAAALAIKLLDRQDVSAPDKAVLMQHLLHPKPRVDLMQLLRLYASAAIDISDGLSADLNHICIASGVGACLTKDALPVHPLLIKYLGNQAVDLALRGGDDYELCFTVSAQHLDSLMAELKKAGLVCYPIGLIEELSGLRIRVSDTLCEALMPSGYSHF
ncbi:MAG: thiamine-phosphate kinase [Legionellales bacterium]